MKKFRCLLSLLLACCLFVSVLPMSATAEEVDSGTCGDGVNWSLSSGTLTISGNGAMADQSLFSDGETGIPISHPWGNYVDQIHRIVVESGITSIGKAEFHCCRATTEVSLPDTLKTIGEYAFNRCSKLKSIVIPSSVKNIGRGTFWHCVELENAVLPDTISSIPDSMFWGCSFLRKVTIPSSITSIEDDAFYACDNLSDIYFEGTEQQWRNVSIGGNCQVVRKATIHYGTKPEDPTPAPLESSASVRFLTEYDSVSQQVTFHEGVDISPFTYTLSHDVDTSKMSLLLNKYVLANCKQINDSLNYSVTDIQLVESRIGTVSVTEEHFLTIDGKKYPVRGDYTLGNYDGQKVLYHISHGIIVGFSKLEEKHGTLEGWNSATKRVTIDGVEYPTNNLTDLTFLANLDNYLRKGVYYTTSTTSGYTPLLAITGFYYPGGKLEDFNADIYHAKWLNKGGTDADILDDQTPSEILIENIEENNGDIAMDMWRSFELVFDTLDDVTTLYDFAVKPKDVYSALILDALEASTSYDIIPSEFEDGIKLCNDLISDLSKAMKTNYRIDLNNDAQFQDIVSRMPGVDVDKYLENFTSEWFKKKQLDLGSLGKSFKWFSKGIKTVGSVEDFAEYCAECYTLMQVSDSMKAVLERAYQKSVRVYGASDNMTLAFKECLSMITHSLEDMIDQIGKKGLTVIGKKGGKYLVGNVLWGKISSYVKQSCPEVAILQLGYKAGKTISNWLCNTDDAVEQYLKMDYATDIESMIDTIFDDIGRDFSKNSNLELATTYLSAMELSFQLRDVDCDVAYKYVDILDETLLSKIEQFFGKKGYDELKEAIDFSRSNYKLYYFGAETDWVAKLDDDFPGSGLYEKYDALIDESQASIPKKEITAACPINVYVYDNANNVVGSIVNGRVTCQADDIMIALIDNEKVIRFFDGADYRVEYVGYDTGDMEVTITEFDENESTVRTVNYYDVALNDGKTYAIEADDQTLQPYVLEDKTDSTAVEHDYDSMDTSTAHTVKVISGTLQQNEEIFTETNSQKGETLTLNAYVPDGYQFVRWEADCETAKFADTSAGSTTMVMPDENVVVTAVMKEKAPIPSGPSGPSGDGQTMPTVTVGEGGKAEFSSDGTVLTITPDEGYEVKDVLKNSISQGAVSQLTGLQPEDVIEVTFAKVQQLPYTDVQKDAWFYESVKYVTENGLMNGLGNGKFGPNDKLTRAQIAQILYNKEGRPNVSPDSGFVDVAKDMWYAKAISWASENDIVSGYGGKRFGPKDLITREQLATILWRYDGSPEVFGNLDRFTDGNKTSTWAESAMQWAVAEGIMNGNGNGTITPTGRATRAEVATIMKNYCEKMKDGIL